MIDGVWAHVVGPGRQIRVPADGCADLILHERDGRVWVTVYEPTTRAVDVTLLRGATMAGVRMRAGYGGGLLRAGAVERAEARARAGEDLAVIACELCVAPPPIISDFVALAHERDGNVRIDQIALDGAAERRLERAAREHLGLTPKGYLRIVRAHAARAALAHAPPLALAADLGFADQSHLTRELLAVIGMTPRALSEIFKTASSAGPMMPP